MAAANFGKLGLDGLDLQGKRVIMRVDFNVPMKKGKVTNDIRIRGALPSIKKVLSGGGSLVLLSHMGRPQAAKMEKGSKEFMEKFSLRPVADRLSRLLEDKVHVQFGEDSTNAKQQCQALKPGQVILLENVRFSKDEDAKKQENRLRLAKVFASYGDLFVSDAFGTAHRDSATMTGIAQVMGGGYAGYLIKTEIDYFAGAMRNPARPFVAIVGGAKVSDKILLLGSLLRLCDKMIIGGAMAYTFLKCLGHTTGKSKVEVRTTSKATGEDIDIVAHVSDIMRAAKVLNVKLILPVDHRCAREFKDVEPHVTVGRDVPDGMMALDIGPKSEKIFREEIQTCRTAIWNGPPGVFEFENFGNGTKAVATALAETPGMLSICGGGDTGAAAEKTGVASKISHISTGGGASLELCEGKVLPGLNVLTSEKMSTPKL